MATDPPTTPATAPTPTPRRARRPRGSRIRWIIRALVGVPLLLIAVGLLLMRSPLVGRLVASQVRDLTGATLESRRAVLTLNSQLIITDLSLTVPGVDGPASEILSAPQAIADLDWRQLPPARWFFTPRGPTIKALRLSGPVIRLSQAIEDDSLNITALKPSTGGGQATELPLIDIIEGRIEFAEHSTQRDHYEKLNELPIAGVLLPDAAGDAGRGFSVRLQEIGRAPSVTGEPRGLVLDGRVDLAARSVSLRVLNLSLDAWPAEAVPTNLRDAWRRLAVQGRVTEGTLDYAPDRELSVGVKLSDVAIVVPVPTDDPDDEDGYLSLRAVHGKVALSRGGVVADLRGRLEDQPGESHVQLWTRGIDLTSGFRCEIATQAFHISETPQFLPYVPPIVRQYLEAFGGPTAEVDTQVVIERGDPVNGQPAPLKVPDGRMKFANGRAAFHKFPYPFRDMAGEVRFDDQMIRIVKITGIGPAGSPLTATGLITPLDENAQVDLNIDVDRVPIDADLLAAMRPLHRRLTEVLFSEEGYADLEGRGFVRRPGGLLPTTSPSTEASPPEFGLGGLAEVRIKVHRPRGDGVTWATDINVLFKEAGLVPEPFPFPIIARDLRLHITDDQAVFEGGEFRGLRGGSAQVDARVRFGAQPTDPVEPDVRITALDLPVDDLLLNAVPGSPQGGNTADRPLNAKAILERFDLRGEVDCRVALSAAAEKPSPDDFIGPLPELPIDYTVIVELDKLTAAPAAAFAPGGDGSAPAGLCVRELSGAIRITRSGVWIDDLRAALGRLTESDDGREAFAMAAPAGSLTIRLDAETTPPGVQEQGRLRALIGVDALDLADPIEDAVNIFSREAAAFISDMRQSRAPAGIVSAEVSLASERGPADVPVEVKVQLSRAPVEVRPQLTIAAFGGRLGVSNPSGTFRFTTQSGSGAPAGGPTLGFDALRADLAFNGAEAGAFELRGGFTRSEHDLPIAAPADLHCTLTDWRFESDLLAAIAAEFGGDSIRQEYAGFSPRGRFDASVAITAPAGAGPDTGTISGVIQPRSLAFVRRGQPVSLSSISGRLTFQTALDHAERDGVSGRIEDAEIATDSWSAAGQGQWRLALTAEPGPSRDQPTGRLTIDASLRARAERIDDSLLALLPPGVDRAIDSASIVFSQPLVLSDASIRAEIGSGEPADRASFLGTLDFAGLAADLGVAIDDAAGRLEIDAGERFRASLRGTSLRMAGVRLTDAHAEIEQDAPGIVSIRSGGADCHGGRVLAEARASWVPGDRAGPSRFSVDATVADVNFAPLLDELAVTSPIGPGVDADASARSTTDASRGVVDARFSIEGVAGDQDSRQGRGAIRISNGDVLRLPVILPLMQVSNLMLPSNDRLNYMQTSFFVDGRRVVFEDIGVFSESIAIIGSGTMTTPELALNMRFNTKSNQRIPLWSDFFEALRDEIASTTVTGTVAKPVIRSEPLTTTRRMIGDIVSPGDPDRRSSRPDGTAGRDFRRQQSPEAAVEPDRAVPPR